MIHWLTLTFLMDSHSLPIFLLSSARPLILGLDLAVKEVSTSESSSWQQSEGSNFVVQLIHWKEKENGRGELDSPLISGGWTSYWGSS